MVEIKFDSTKLELSMEGHAEYAEHGKDIVCAAVSILFYTLAESLEQSNFTVKVSKSAKAGKVKIKVKPKENFIGNIQLMFWQTMNGFQLLADDYPENVKLTIS